LAAESRRNVVARVRRVTSLELVSLASRNQSRRWRYRRAGEVRSRPDHQIHTHGNRI